MKGKVTITFSATEDETLDPAKFANHINVKVDSKDGDEQKPCLTPQQLNVLLIRVLSVFSLVKNGNVQEAYRDAAKIGTPIIEAMDAIIDKKFTLKFDAPVSEEDKVKLEARRQAEASVNESIRASINKKIDKKDLN